jgi:plastocyanin
MRKHWFRSIGFGGLSAIGLVLGLQQAAPAADNVKEIEIVRNATRKFVFAEPNVTINAGQSIKWHGKEAVPHQLDGNPPSPLFKATPEFKPPETATVRFDKPGVIPYHCNIHPTMVGTITVK